VLANMLLPGILNAGLTRRVVLSSRPELEQTLLARIPIGEFGTAEQVAAAYAYLCSSDSDYMTGNCLTMTAAASWVAQSATPRSGRTEKRNESNDRIHPRFTFGRNGR